MAFRACQFLSVAEVSFAIRAKYSRMSLTWSLRASKDLQSTVGVQGCRIILGSMEDLWRIYRWSDLKVCWLGRGPILGHFQAGMCYVSQDSGSLALYRTNSASTSIDVYPPFCSFLLLFLSRCLIIWFFPPIPWFRQEKRSWCCKVHEFSFILRSR